VEVFVSDGRNVWASAKPWVAATFLILIAAVMVFAACRAPSGEAAEEAQGPPTATHTPGPTATPTTTLTPSITPTASQTPVGLVGPNHYPEGINPLTGLPVDDPSVLDRLPLAVKICNAPPVVRPQAGLNSADIVIEHYTEGTVTRLTAIYYSQTPERVGPVRSGRLIDLEIPVMYDAIFTSSGFSDGVHQLMLQAPWRERNFTGTFGYGDPLLYRMFEDEDTPLEFTLFASPAAIWEYADFRGLNHRPELVGMAFSSYEIEGGVPATQIAIDYIGSPVDWKYSADDGLYRRWQDGEPHADALTGEQVFAANVVVIGAVHVDTDILEDAHWNLASIEIQIWGEGPMVLFRDGRTYEGTWHRESREQEGAGFSFTGADGDVLPLRPGNTWIQVVPLDMEALSFVP
jgi:hypothetical protein